jgi:MSHA biogenesis protein MshN
MSLINDMLRDLDRRNYQSIVGGDRTLPEFGHNGSNHGYSSLERLRPVIYAGVVFAVLFAGFTLGNAERSRHSPLPDIHGIATAILSTFQPATTDVTETQNIDRHATLSDQKTEPGQLEQTSAQSRLNSAAETPVKPATIEPASGPADGVQKTPEPLPSKSRASVSVASDSTAALQPQSKASTADSSRPGYIEVTHRPLSAKQQRLQEYHAAAGTYREGNLTEAAQQLEDLLVRDNGQHQARLLLARVYSQQNQDNRAVLVLSNGLIHYPNHVPYITLYAKLLAAQGRDNEALITLRNAPSEALDSAEYHALLAGVYQRTGDSTAASDSYLAALRIDPAHGEWWMGLGIASEQSGEEDRAEYAYNEALQYPLASVVKSYVKLRLQQLALEKTASPSVNK